MTIDEIIKKIEMVRDDLCDSADGARCQAAILAEAAAGLDDVKKTSEELLNRLEQEEWKTKGLPDKDEEVLAEFAVKQEWDELPEAYYLVCRFDREKEEWRRAIDNDLILDRLIAWKRII